MAPKRHRIGCPTLEFPLLHPCRRDARCIGDRQLRPLQTPSRIHFGRMDPRSTFLEGRHQFGSILQFIPCEDDPVGSRLVKDPRISAVVLTGATLTAKLFLKMRPGLDLMAETGGKNTVVITECRIATWRLEICCISAFGHAGQKCSACSLAILEAEVYDDPHFRQQLRDAAASLPVGSPWDLKTKINPLIRPPGPTLLKGLKELEEGEEWLLEPKQDPHNPHLWSPGIKLGVKVSSFYFPKRTLWTSLQDLSVPKIWNMPFS